MSTIATERTRTQTKWMRFIGAWHRRSQMQLLMLMADLCGFAVAGGLVLGLNRLLRIFVLNAGDLKYLIVPVLCLGLFVHSKLYPGVGINPAEEIKLVTQYVTTGFIGGWIVLGWMQSRWIPNAFAFAILWALAIVSILLLRWSVRIQAARLGVWGEPVAVMGERPGADRIISYFMLRRRLGFVPVMAVLDAEEGHPLTFPLPVIERRNLPKLDAGHFAREGIQTLVADVPAISGFLRSDESKAFFRLFRRVILVSDVDWIDGASMRIQDFEGIIGIEAEKSLLTAQSALLKRAVDVAGAIITGVVLLPLMLATAIWIQLDSPGGVFYSHERIGKGGRKIKIHKFRSMFRNSEDALQAYLSSHAGARDEWDAKQKLCADPRITRVGIFLRKYSIDEIPQLLNVLKGEMSLVGPRPIVESEQSRYAESIDIYRSTRPGMTGLWQVSGRSQTSYEERVRYDMYYVRNWSVWLDIYVLLRTVWMVLIRDGAY